MKDNVFVWKRHSPDEGIYFLEMTNRDGDDVFTDVNTEAKTLDGLQQRLDAMAKKHNFNYYLMGGL